MSIKIIDEILATFEADPPDDEFQRGYRQALIELRVRLTQQNN